MYQEPSIKYQDCLRFTVYCLLLFMLPGFANAQFSLSGKVRDPGGRPLSSASVELQNTFLKTITDTEGSFSFKNLKSGSYDMKITFIGFKTYTEKINLTSGIVKEISLIKSAIVADEVVVTSTRASQKSAAAYSILDKEEIEKNNLGKDVPFLLNSLPSVVITSDAGNGVGYTGIRIRGSDASRINVTVNGIPINDAESQQMYWVDLPDIISSTHDVQVQRGVGSSTNGAGSFGGSINIQTNQLSSDPYAQSSVAYGSFNTVKTNAQFGTGLINNHFSFDARLTKIASDGFVDRASSDLKSFYLSGGYYGKKSLLRFIVFSGKEVTYQSWYGVPQAKLDGDKDALLSHYYNNIGQLYFNSQDSINLFNSDNRTYNIYTYKNQVDDYQQDNYQLHFSQSLSDDFTFNGALHLTQGKGFYEEYKKSQDLTGYGIEYLTVPQQGAISDLVRRKWLDNDFYGFTYSLIYEKKNVQGIFGGAWNQYSGDHFGEIVWTQSNYGAAIPYPYQYYSDGSLKTDFNMYAKTSYEFNSRLSGILDLQYRQIGYNLSAPDENDRVSPQHVEFSFFNPKAGIVFKPGPTVTTYLSFGVGNKEPSRNDFRDNLFSRRPKSEQLYDVEAGVRFQGKKFSVNCNLYGMIYNNQLVLNGSLNEVGEPLRINVKESSRYGIELEAGYSILQNLSVRANATFSVNTIQSYYEYVFNYDTYQYDSTEYKNTPIAFSPDWIGAASLNYNPVKNVEVVFFNKYVGKQFLDNTGSDDRSIKMYTVSDLQVNYTVPLKWVKSVLFGVQLNNIFNQEYVSNGYTYSYIYGGLITENFYYPQAGFNIIGQIAVKF